MSNRGAAKRTVPLRQIDHADLGDIRHDELRKHGGRLPSQELAGRGVAMPLETLLLERGKIAPHAGTEAGSQPVQKLVVALLICEKSLIVAYVLRLAGDLVGDDLVELRREIRLDFV